MKKHLLLFALALAATIVQAQTGELYSFQCHTILEDDLGIESVAQQRNGQFLIAIHISANSGSPAQPPLFLGNVFYKMSPDAFTAIDSIFEPDSVAPYYFFARDPISQGNIRVNIEYVEEKDSTYVRICHFSDNEMLVNHDEDAMVALCQGVAYDELNGFLVDCWGDLIVKYDTPRPDGGYDIHIARIDPAGTLKHNGIFYQEFDCVFPNLQVFKESPLQYCEWMFSIIPNSNVPLILHVIDSLFNMNPVVVNDILREDTLPGYPFPTVYERFLFNSDSKVISVGGDDILVAAQYVNDTIPRPMTAEYGVAVAKYDIRTMQLKDYVVFNDYPGCITSAACMGLKRMSDGTVYLMYKERGYPDESIVVVKMDADLNVDWKRFCKTKNISMLPINPYLQVYEDEQGEERGIAWIGVGTNATTIGIACFILNHDGTIGTNDSNMEVRPYAFCPNPAKDRIRFQFSPDVQPKQIDLHDLQGRLVRTQSGSLESIDLSSLPAGTYMLRVTMADGTTYSDKVVKE